MATAIAWAPGKLSKDDKVVVLQAHRRITEKQSLTVAQIAYTELWVRAPYNLLLHARIQPCHCSAFLTSVMLWFRVRPTCLSPGLVADRAAKRLQCWACGRR